MGVDATGQVFNSIVAVEQYKGAEMNAMVNPGAITATSMVAGATADEVWAKLIGTYNDYAGRSLSVLQDVYKSEAETNQRNQAISMLMYAYGHIKDNPLQACDLYTKGCSVGVNAKDLAMMAATLANGGTNPVTGKVALKPEYVPEVLAVMATAGLYDDSGKWLYATGLPAKSGVGGGIIAVSPGKFGIAAISPPLDAAGQQRARPEGDRRHLERAGRQSLRFEAGRRRWQEEEVDAVVLCNRGRAPVGCHWPAPGSVPAARSGKNGRPDTPVARVSAAGEESKPWAASGASGSSVSSCSVL